MESLLKGNPGLKLEIVATDTLVDIVEEGFDAGIRFGERLSQDMIAVRIRSNLRFVVVGSPVYFEGRKVPSTPHDLRNQACIRYAFPSGAIFNWEFFADGKTIQVEVDGPLTVDSQELMVAAAVRGLGLAYVWEDRVAPYLRSGQLKVCLDDWSAVEKDLFLYYPSRKHQSAGLRALVETLKA
jgi:DNA-binding transcriptional LysR family regulator